MRSHLDIRFLIPLLVVFMTGPGQLAAQGWPDRELWLTAGPGAPRFDQRLQRPGWDKTRTPGVQRPRSRWPNPQRRWDRVNTLKMWKLTEYLDLSEEQAEKFFPRQRDHQKQADEIARQRRQLYEEFQQKVDEGKVSAREVDRYVADIARLDKSLIDLRTKHIESLKDSLTDEQRAKFAIFNEHFRRQIQHRLQGNRLPPLSPNPDGKED